MNEFDLMPPAASQHAVNIDQLYFYIWGICGFFILLIAGLIVYFAMKYQRTPGNEVGARVRAGVVLEIVWTVVPLVLAMSMFVWGARLYIEAYRVPPDAMEIHVVARQWMWKLQHPQGRREINELHVPTGRDIMLMMTSQDVIHSFFVPAFRVKQDVLPGRYTSLWFNATRPGTYHLFCAEYCGTLHSGMIGKVVVMDPAQYEDWLAAAPAEESPGASGEKLFSSLGCVTCHGSRAPTLAGVYGSQVTLQDGSRVQADENYLRESILNPPAKIVAGYEPIMPSFRGQLSEEQVMQLISYIKSLKGDFKPQQTPPAEKPLTPSPSPARGEGTQEARDNGR